MKTRYVLKNWEECTGCNSCYNICSQKAILFTENQGFKYPVINMDKCINCGMCVKVCPYHNREKGTEIGKVYACQNKSSDILSKSSSGGVFASLAKLVYENGGVVYACKLDRNFQAKHIRSDRQEELNELLGSKYVQSDIGSSYRQAEKDLKNNKLVLFCGTPCQIAGLKSFIKKNYENLITMDFICHGVPSPIVLKKYLNHLEEKYRDKITSVSFRNKENGWYDFSLKITFENKNSIVETRKENLYLRTFLTNNSIRSSCYHCKYNCLPRLSDITVGDFWGIEKIDSDFSDNKGTSMVMLNNVQGANLFSQVKQEFKYKEKTIEEVKSGNPFIDGHCKPGKRRKQFFRKLYKEEIENNMLSSLKVTKREIIQSVISYKIIHPIKTKLRRQNKNAE